MENQTIALLKECSAGCRMAEESMCQIRKATDDQKLGALIAEYKGKHEKLKARVDSMLAAEGYAPKEPPVMASAFAKASPGVKLSWKEDSHQAAKILMDGCSMGIKTISSHINQSPEASAESLGAAKDLVRMEEEFNRELKQFV